MRDENHDIEGVAREVIERFGDGAAHVARELAEIAQERHRDQSSATMWRDIAATVERLWPKR